MAVAGAPWQLECENVEQRCGYLLTSTQWSDCTFVLGSETNQEVVPAHKLVLAMASPVFEAMFYGGLSEHNEPIVSIPDVTAGAFRALLQYTYTGNISIDSFSMACNLWYAAKKYMLPYLVKKCNTYICSVLGTSNACQTYELARLFDEKTLMEKCIKIISTNTKEVLNDSSFEDVHLNTVITVCSLDQLTVDSELDLFYAVERYAEAGQRSQAQISPSADAEPPLEEQLSEKELLQNESSCQTSPAVEHDSKPSTNGTPSKATADTKKLNEKEPSIHTAVQSIRFLSLSAAQFASGPACSNLLTKDETLAIFMNIATTDSPVPMPSGFTKCRERRQPCNNSVKGPFAKLRPKPSTESRGAARLLTPDDIDSGLWSNDPGTVERAARAARHMSCADVDGSSKNTNQLVDRFGFTKHLVAALEHSCTGVQYEAAWAITYIACKRPTALVEQKQCFEAGSLEHTIHALKCGEHSQVTDAARAARNILCTPDDIQGALDKGILDALVPALTEGDDLCKYYAAGAISDPCYYGSPSQLSVLAASAALEPYCRLLASTWGDTCYTVLDGLTYLLKKVKKNTKVALLRKLREIGVPQLLITAQQGGNANDRKLATDLLRTYFDNEQ